MSTFSPPDSSTSRSGKSCNRNTPFKPPLTAPSEAVLRRRIVRRLKQQYPTLWEYHPCDRFRSAVPDELLCINGRFIALEIKRPGLAPTPLQAATLGRIALAGGLTGCVHSVEETVALMETVHASLS